MQKDGPSKIPIVKKEPAPAKARKRKSDVVKVEADEGPRRRSGRLRGLEIDSKELVKIELVSAAWAGCWVTTNVSGGEAAS